MVLAVLNINYLSMTGAEKAQIASPITGRQTILPLV